MNIIKKSERSVAIDFIRGIAILLVIMGHSIEYGSGWDYFYNNRYFDSLIFKIIYSFHMPLFALVSGFLNYYSVANSRDCRHFIISKVKTLLFPVFIWSTTEYLIRIIIACAKGNTGELSFEKYLSNMINSFWFLWALFFISIVVLCVEKLLHNKVFYIFIIIILMLVPPVGNMQYFLFVMPYYVVGYMFHENQEKSDGNSFFYRIWKNYTVLIFVATLLCWLGMICFYNIDSYIYTSQLYLFGYKGFCSQLIIDIYRWLIGLFGTLLVIELCMFVHFDEKNIAEKGVIVAGKTSLGIYIVSGYIFQVLLKLLSNSIPNIVVWVIETMIITFSCIVVTAIIRSNTFLSKAYLGGR